MFCHANITWNSGRVRQAARRLQQLHHLLEGDVLVVLRPERPLLHPLQQLRHGGRAGEVDAHRQRVDEEADQPLDLPAARLRARRADDHVRCPDSRPSTTAQPASSVMYERGPCRCASASSPALSSSSSSTPTLAPAQSCRAGRGMVGGQLQQLGGAPESVSFQYSAAACRGGEPRVPGAALSHAA